MTSLLRDFPLRARVSSLVCSLFISLTLARLARRGRDARPRRRPAQARFAYSGFRRFACLLMVAVVFVQFTLFPPEVSHAAVKAVSATAVNYGQGAHFWWHSSGWAAKYERLRNQYLRNVSAQAKPRGWDGKGAPGGSRPAPRAVETQQDRERRVALVKIFPGDVEIKTGEQVVFNAIALDQDGNSVGGVDTQWSALDERRNQPITVSHGTFVSGVPGRFIITAEVAGRRGQVKVKVTGEPRRPNLRGRSEEPKSSRESRRIGSLRAPTSGDQKRIAGRGRQAGTAALPGGKQSGTPALPGPLRAASAPMAALPAVLFQGEDETGWRSENNDTMDDVGSERGSLSGRAIDGGAGSGNFQFAAPVAVLDGRGIDISLLFNYNSRVWHKAGSQMTFDIDRDWIAGWSLGFGKIVMAGDTYMLIDGDGTRHPYDGTLRRGFPSPASSLQSFEGHTTDGTFIDFYAEGYQPQFNNSGGRNMIMAWAVMPNGTRIEYGAPANYAMYPTRITDAHGNFITVTYRNNEGPNIETIYDALGRVIRFYYDNSNLLTTITAPGLNGGGERQLVRLAYQYLTLSNAGSNYGFSGVSTVVRQNMIPVVLGICYPATGTGYWFGDGDSYSKYGMIRKVSERRGMTVSGGLNEQGSMWPGVQTHVQVYSNPSSPGYSDIQGFLSDTPTYTQMTEDWVGRTTTSAPVTQFSVVDGGGTRTTTITRPDGAQLLQVADNNQSSATYGMLLEDTLYQDSSHSVVLSRSMAFWEIGAYNSPRPWRTESYDELGRMTATTYSYDPNYGSLYNSVTDARAYGYGGEQLRHTRTEYLNNINYNGSLQNSGMLWWKQGGGLSGGPIWLGQHIFNLVSRTDVYGGDDVTRLSRTEYQYDGLGLTNNPGMVQHNSWYNPHTPPQEVCEQVPDMNDPDCREECGPCQNPPCPEPPPECDGNCPYIQNCYTVPQYDWRTGYRGNVTQVKSYADAASLDEGTAVVETRTYDIAGNVREQTTSCCEKTTFTYTINTHYAWPESQTAGSPTDQSKQNTTSATYDYWTGLVMTSTDANGRVSDTEYDPGTLRPVRQNSSTDAYTYHAYDDLNLKVEDYVYEAGAFGPNVASRKDKYLDGLGRMVKEVAFGKNYAPDVVETQFDNLGRAWRQTRPYRANSNLTPAETVQWSTVTYDRLDRPIQTVSPDNSVVTRAYNQSPDPSGSSGQPGPTVKVTDPWGRERWARSDALGRMVEVAEPNPGGNGALSGGAMYTTYSYDALDRLLQVNQGAQLRRFRYDSLGRMTHQKLAERAATLDDDGNYVGGGTWSDRFFYDTRSNLTIRADARGVRTFFNYDDPLNRLQWIQYNKDLVPPYLAVDIPGSYGVSYPNINVVYSYVTTGDKRRVRTVGLDAGMGNQLIDYDAEGRVSQVNQTFGGRESYPLVTNHLFDSLDRIKEVQYPQQYGAGEARKVVAHNYDMASRIDSVQFDGVTMASNPVYNASSQVTSVAVGSQTTENYNFDPKTGLLVSQQVNKGPEQLVNLHYNYTLNNDANNNGAKTWQLTSVTDVNNLARNRAYEYDKLGRLSKVKGGVNAFSSPTWYQNYSYDRYGNRSMVEQNGDAVWVDDALPAGASAASEGGDSWNWLGYSPAPYSGTVSHQSIIASETRQHYFQGATQTLQVNAGDSVYAYVYLDPANRPSEVMLQWCSNQSGWGHRAYWGANDIPWGTDGTADRKYMGPLPAAGGWVRLEVPASAVALEGKTLHGMAFTLHGGRVTWDQAGKANVAGNTVWVDDALPAGAVGYSGGEDWTWVGPSPSPQSGVVSHQSNVAAGLHQHFFDNAGQTLKVNAGDKLYAWVYLDPANVPQEVMLQWSEATAGWSYKAYWGADILNWPVNGTKINVGPLPQAGGWVKLEVPASALGLEGKELKGMAFTLYGGRANWDKAGKTRGIASSMPLDGLANIGYNPTNNRINTAGFAYDAAGNQTRTVVDASGGQQVSQYDCAGRLARVLDGSGNELARYVYGEGKQRLMSIEGGVTKFFAWAGGQSIAEYQASGANALVWKTSYVYLGGRLLATTSGTGGTETRFHHPGHLGTRLVTDSGGTVVSEQFTLPFGNMQPFTSVYGGENPYQNPTLSNPSKKRFTSYDRSDATGLDYAVNRFYSVQQGRFTQVDPIGMGAASLSDPQTLNMYAYCGNDPINCVDPDGLFFGKLFGWIGKAFKWAFRVLAVAVAVVAVVAAFSVGQYWGSILITKGLVAMLFGSSALLATAGWGPGKIGQIAGAIVTGGLSGRNNFRTPSTFPGGRGVGGRSRFVSGSDDEEIIPPDSILQMEAETAYSSYWEYLKAAFNIEHHKRHIKRDLEEVWKRMDHAGRTGEGLPLIGGLGGATSGMVTVSRWGRPGLQSGDWVMKGRASWWNYLKSGKWQPGFGNEFAPFRTGAEFQVPASSLRWPRGFGIDGWVKGLYGQRRYIP